jgi:hypothetical protein
VYLYIVFKKKCLTLIQKFQYVTIFRGNGHQDLYKKSDINDRSFEMYTGILPLL